VISFFWLFQNLLIEYRLRVSSVALKKKLLGHLRFKVSAGATPFIFCSRQVGYFISLTVLG